MNRHHVHVFECEGVVNAAQTTPHRFLFRVYADTSMTVVVSPVAEGSSRHCGNSDSIEQSPGHEPECYVYNGRAVRHGGDGDATRDANDLWFACSFKIVRFWRRRTRSQLMACHGQLSVKYGLKGRYVIIRADDGDAHSDGNADDDAAGDITTARGGGHVFRGVPQIISQPIMLQLHLISYRKERVINPVAPLTPGQFVFQGVAVSANGRVYACRHALTVGSDAKLHGVVQMGRHPREGDPGIALNGTWCGKTLKYSTQDGGSDTHPQPLSLPVPVVFSAVACLGSVRGRWEVSGTPATTANGIRDDYGHLELHVVHTQRHWSPCAHFAYPTAFQDVVNLLLLKTLRSPSRSTYAIPVTIWTEILSFCEYQHFESMEDRQHITMSRSFKPES